MKYIIVSGGVLSGLGKGITASSIGLLLKSAGYRVTAIKIDPYLNCDAGTMNPYQHGEVYVMNDGGEVDLDLGNYERFLDTDMTRDNNITTGKVYQSVIRKEREGKYLGNTVQIIPHITNEIRENIIHVSRDSGSDVAIVELGGTVGDIESMPFIEALRQLRMGEGAENVIFIHTTLVPIMGVVGEQKTKPTQHSVKELKGLGIQPDVIVARCKEPLNASTQAKISLFCDVPKEAVISAHDLSNVYRVPLLLLEQGITDIIYETLSMEPRTPDIEDWKGFIDSMESADKEVTIALVGKYTDLKDAYISHAKAISHASAALGVVPVLKWIESTDLEEAHDPLKGVDAVIIPGGFGVRGSEGKIKAIQHARENDIPFLGICFGFQLAAIEYARNVMGWEDATSAEFEIESEHIVVDLLPEQIGVTDMGSTMRLGAHDVLVADDTMAHDIYGSTTISERHRHRFEINPEFIEPLQESALTFSGRDTEGIRMELLELSDHPFFMASQFHPEFRSRPLRPAPLYHALVRAARDRR